MLGISSGSVSFIWNVLINLIFYRLDEPTTNLDHENIHSLADALGDLVANQASANFQLIVITHDEDFLNQLIRVDQMDHFFRVSRNDRGNSIIRKNLVAGNN